MTRKASNVVSMPDAAASVQRSGESTITWNKRLGDESITLRTHTVEELMTLRDQLAKTLPPSAEADIHEGADCPRHECTGKLSLKTGSRGAFYGCNAYPACRFTARA